VFVRESVCVREGVCVCEGACVFVRENDKGRDSTERERIRLFNEHPLWTVWALS